MDSVILLVLVILSSSLLYTSVVHSRANDATNDETAEIGENGNDCSLWVPEKDASKMPIPFTTNGKRHSIIYPDAKGHLNVGRGRGFRLSCAAGRFESADLENASDALVSCVGGDRLRYRAHVYKYEDFRCDRMPKSELRVTDETCQPENYTVLAVGFQTKTHFLGLYYMCFDKSTENSLYSWYDARSPFYDNHQKDSRRPTFAKTKELYGKTDVNRKYTVNEQRKTVAKILRSDKLADKYIKNDSKHSLSRGHYTAKADFFFAYEQMATFYYANVAPQWQVFNGDLWAKLEDKTRRRLARDTGNGTQPPADGRHGRRVIVTGSYGSCTLPDADGVQQPLFLDPPRGVPVPLFYWKLDYDADADDGIVSIGLNDPYREIDDAAYLCPEVKCPDDDDDDNNDNGDGDDDDDDDDDGKKYGEANGGEANDDDTPVTNEGLIYCCTMKTFEEFYGRLDRTVFAERDDE